MVNRNLKEIMSYMHIIQFTEHLDTFRFAYVYKITYIILKVFRCRASLSFNNVNEHKK